MRLIEILSRHSIAAGMVVTVLIAWCFAYEPVTRNLIATDAVCSYCHMQREYVATARLSFSKSHPIEPTVESETTRCVDCHLPEGFWATTFAYTHAASVTDLFGHFRDRASERAGDWIPFSAARAYRVRDRLHEYDSSTCRSCHIESEIKPKRERGQTAHADALENNETCVVCHNNMVHRFVELREAPVDEETEAVDEFGDEELEVL